MRILHLVAVGSITRRAQAIAVVLASDVVLPALKEALRVNPGLAMVVQALVPFLLKVGVTDAACVELLCDVPRGAYHSDISCDGCGCAPLLGVRFKCAFCSDYDLCESCYSRHASGGVHEPSHPFIKIHAPGAEPQRVAPVATAVTHASVTCDGCGVTPIIGVRWKCSVCEVRRVPSSSGSLL
jgi:hypothetical protein